MTPEDAIEDVEKKLLEPAAKERQRKSGGDKKSAAAKSREKSVGANLPQSNGRAPRASDSAAASLNVSRKSVDHASTVIANGSPELVALVAARMKKLLEPAAKERKKRKAKSVVENLPPQNGKARDKAGAALGVSGKSVDHASTVIANGSPELVALVAAMPEIRGVWSRPDPSERGRRDSVRSVIETIVSY